uniref:Putative nonstructural protein NS1 n=1 Tax=Saxicola torquata ambidensovirus TaxID=2794450 RepID=A0A8E7G2J3_9VIRU|nr:MAG: putative nonstructural protein NS1 [Saxicola torquata ambidensovirus]
MSSEEDLFCNEILLSSDDDDSGCIGRDIDCQQPNPGTSGAALERNNVPQNIRKYFESVDKASNRRQGAGREKNLDENAGSDEESFQIDEDSKDSSRYSSDVRELYRIPKKRKIIHDVIVYPDKREACRRIRECLSHGSKSAVQIISWHRDHVHYIHDCSYTESKCRCVRTAMLRGDNRTIRRHIWTHRYTIKWWNNLTIYLSHNERDLLYIEIGQRIRFRSSEVGGFSVHGSSWNREGTMVEESEDEESFYNTFQCGSLEDESGPVNPDSSQEVKERRRKSGTKEDKFIRWLQQYPTSPILAVFKTKQYMDSKFYFWNLKSNRSTKCIEKYQQSFIPRTTTEQFNYLTKCTPIFAAVHSDVLSYYFSPEESMNVIMELLKFQFEEESEIIQFLCDVLIIVDKRKEKCNSLFVYSEPGGGKNYFFDAVCHFYNNVGNVANFNKYSQFPLMDCIDRRIIMWNEPDYEPAAIDTIKLLFGGDPCAARVKYNVDTVIFRTPVISLANSNCFPNNEAFNTRMIRYQWRACPLLKAFNKKVHPLGFYYLLNYFDIFNKVDVIIQGPQLPICEISLNSPLLQDLGEENIFM